MHRSTRSHRSFALTRSAAGLGAVLLAASCGDSRSTTDETARVSAALTPLVPLASGGTAALRAALTSAPPAPALAAAVAAFQSADPSATFTWLRGHVDAFAARPKSTIPAYARAILAQAGLPSVPRSIERVATTSAPNQGGHLDDLSQPLTDPGEAPAPDTLGPAAPSDVDGAPPPPDLPRDTRMPPAPSPSGHSVAPVESAIAKAILAEFLRRNAGVFELDAELLGGGLPNLKLVRYGAGQFGRRAVFQQYINGLPLLAGKTVVLFDANWNVTAISRQLTTASKLALSPDDGLAAQAITLRALSEIATRYDVPTPSLVVREATRGVDVVRGIVAWQVRVAGPNPTAIDHTVTLHARSGAVLNVSSNIDYFGDAQLLRWGYANGDFTLPTQYLETNVYTRDDNSLEHDFFFLANDDRTNGTLSTCKLTPVPSLSATDAYDTTSSSTYIRPTQRSDRDFTLWQPSAPKGSFGEGQVYYWARSYMQWLKGSLDDLGVLPAVSSDYPKALVVVNACEDGSGVTYGSYPVTTLSDKGEGLRTVVLPERCRSGNSNCKSSDYADSNSDDQYTYESDGGYHAPGVVHHELNHFVLHDYFDVNSTLDCSAGIELKYLHEGGLGRTIPQMYWHHHYGVGYAPVQDRLFQSDDPSGAPHTDTSDINTLGGFLCGPSDSKDPNYVNPYQAGGVVAQPLWEIYHGQKVDGAVITAMARPADDTSMLEGNYYAVDMVSASTFQDRYEMANRYMEFWDLFGSALSSTKTDWCSVFTHHGIGTFISAAYCS